jgi:hypothetical protein
VAENQIYEKEGDKSMPNATFVSKVNFVNQLLFPTSLYPSINIPAGVPPYDAIPKSLAEIATIAAERNRRYNYQRGIGAGLGIAAGFTRSDLTVRFENMSRQWQCDERRNWIFLGGSIQLELTLGIYADERASGSSCWGMILEHELLHVRDEIDIVRNFLPNNLSQSAMIRGFLNQPTPDSSFNADIRGTGSGGGSTFEQRIQSAIWIQESSRRASQVHHQRPGDTTAISNCLEAL